MIDGRAASRNHLLAPSRRTLLAASAPAVVFGARRAAADERLQAIAFDAFPIFDPRSIAALARTLLPGDGDRLVAAWLPKLFGYTWLITAAGRYQSFEHLAEASLIATAAALHIEVSSEVRRQLVAAFHTLDLWPDVRPALEQLRKAKLRLAFLSNLGETTLRDAMHRNGLTDAFDFVLSTDQVRRFKPAPEAYAMARSAPSAYPAARSASPRLVDGMPSARPGTAIGRRGSIGPTRRARLWMANPQSSPPAWTACWLLPGSSENDRPHDDRSSAIC